MQAIEPRPGVLHFVVERRLSTELARHILDFVEHSRSQQLSFFHDWSKVTGYDTQARITITSWSVKHRSRLVTAHMLARSKIVRMGVSVANIAVGGIAKLHESQRPGRRSARRARRS